MLDAPNSMGSDISIFQLLPPVHSSDDNWPDVSEPTVKRPWLWRRWSLIVSVFLVLGLQVWSLTMTGPAFRAVESPTANKQIAVAKMSTKSFIPPMISKPVPKRVTHPARTSYRPLSSRDASSGRVSTVIPASSYDLNLLARLVHAEAGNQSFTGKVAVADVVIHRVKSGMFPSNIPGVIYEPGQFQTVSNHTIDMAPTSSDVEAARAALSGDDVVRGALYFQNESLTGQDWMSNHSIIARIGGHTFYS